MGATPAMARFLSGAVRARIGHLVFSSLGPGRDRVLELLLDSLGDERPALSFGQSIWPPSERPTKLRADISSGVHSKADLFSRLAQATPGATLIAASDCGLPLFDLVEASLRAGMQLIYLAWAPQGESIDRFARDLLDPSGTPSPRAAHAAALAQAIPLALPVWVGVEHAPDGSFCISEIAETFYKNGVADVASPAGLRTRSLFGFQAESPSAD